MKLESIASSQNSQLRKIGRNLLYYLKRYGALELAAAVTSTATAEVVNRLTINETAAAYSATAAGYLAYFGTVAMQEVYSRARKGTLTKKDAYKIPTNLLKEFGIPSYLDLAVIRPYILREGIKIFGGSAGAFLGNRIADIPFYSLCILLDKTSKKKLKGGEK